MDKIIELIYNVNTQRFRFKDDDWERLYYKEEKNTRDNVNFKELQKYVKKILKTLHKNNTITKYQFSINSIRYSITFEKE